MARFTGSQHTPTGCMVDLPLPALQRVYDTTTHYRIYKTTLALTPGLG